MPFYSLDPISYHKWKVTRLKVADFTFFSKKTRSRSFVYQLFLQGSDPILIKRLLVRQLLLCHLFCHLDSLHHLLFRFQMGFFNFCLEPETHKRWLKGVLIVIISLYKEMLPWKKKKHLKKSRRASIWSLVLTELFEPRAAHFWRIQSLSDHRLHLSNMTPFSQTAPLMDG